MKTIFSSFEDGMNVKLIDNLGYRYNLAYGFTYPIRFKWQKSISSYIFILKTHNEHNDKEIADKLFCFVKSHRLHKIY